MYKNSHFFVYQTLERVGSRNFTKIYRKVIQEKAFIAEKNGLNTPKFHLIAISLRFSLEFEARCGIFAAFLFQIETQLTGVVGVYDGY
ncbi:hypothetical protein [Cellvibrio sp. UBA7661]|uniref:hypothetical protein n=1 Tax=Cellvibrio sp. UBA7661 TaxID=1946311 RepID=UPI002F356D7B